MTSQHWPQWRRRGACSWGHRACRGPPACLDSPGSPAWSGRTARHTSGPENRRHHSGMLHHNGNVSQCSHQRCGPLVHAGERALLAGPGLLLLPLLPLLGEQLLEAVLLPPEAAHQLPRLAQLSCQPRHVSLGQTRYYCKY